jgi:hypothetical protein
MTTLQGANCWYADRAAWRLIGVRYLPWLAGLNLAWEIAQLPLYTLWREGSPAFIAFSVAHCTLGDALVGAAALAIALIATRAPRSGQWRWASLALVTALVGTVYTGFSEWLNTVARYGWAYSELMPVVRVFGAEIGLSPIAQWLILPPLALRLALARTAVSRERS